MAPVISSMDPGALSCASVPGALTGPFGFLLIDKQEERILNNLTANHQLQLTGAAISVSRDMNFFQRPRQLNLVVRRLRAARHQASAASGSFPSMTLGARASSG